MHSSAVQSFSYYTYTLTSVLEVRWIPHKQHVCVWGVCDTDEASLVLQRGSDTHAGSVGVCGALAVGTTHSCPRHHLTHRHTGVLQPQDYRKNVNLANQFSRRQKLFFIKELIISLYLDFLFTY